MRSSTGTIGAVFAAWYALLGRKFVTAAEVLKLTGGGARREPKHKALADAFAALYPRSKPSVIKVGRWLASHRAVECYGLRLHGDYGENAKVWHWSIEPVQTDAELAAEQAVLIEAAEQQRAAVLAKAKRGHRSGVDTMAAELKFTERPERRAAAAAEEQARSELNRAVRELKNAPDPKAERPERAFTIVAPASGYFTTHQNAERLLRHFSRFTATAAIVRRLDGYAITLDTAMLEERGRTLDDLKRDAERLMLEIRHERGPAPTNNAVSFWQANSVPITWETDPFAMEAARLRSMPVVPSRSRIDAAWRKFKL